MLPHCLTPVIVGHINAAYVTADDSWHLSRVTVMIVDCMTLCISTRPFWYPQRHPPLAPVPLALRTPLPPPPPLLSFGHPEEHAKHPSCIPVLYAICKTCQQHPAHSKLCQDKLTVWVAFCMRSLVSGSHSSKPCWSRSWQESPHRSMCFGWSKLADGQCGLGRV